jgi:hypothetical protein
MGNRTIVAFSHDFAGEIDRDPEGFVRAVRNMLNSGVNDSESQKRDDLRRFGVSTSPTHHNSTKAEVVLTTEADYEFFRQQLS